MLLGLFIILLCQLLGEGVAYATGIAIPGPVIGIVLMLIFMVLTGLPRAGRTLRDGHEATTGAAEGLLKYLGLLFVPAGVGVVQSLDLLSENWLALSIILVLSTILIMVITVLAFRGISLLTGGDKSGGDKA